MEKEETEYYPPGNPDTALNHKALLAQLELALSACGAEAYIKSYIDDLGCLHIKIEVPA